MKIKISFFPDEEETADMIFQAVRRFLPAARVRKAGDTTPRMHYYLTTKKPGNRDNVPKN